VKKIADIVFEIILSYQKNRWFESGFLVEKS